MVKNTTYFVPRDMARELCPKKKWDYNFRYPEKEGETVNFRWKEYNFCLVDIKLYFIFVRGIR